MIYNERRKIYMGEEQNLKIDFAFTDEYGQECRVAKTFTTAVLIDRGTIKFLFDEFKLFLLANGFDSEFVEKSIQLVVE